MLTFDSLSILGIILLVICLVGWIFAIVLLHRYTTAIVKWYGVPGKQNVKNQWLRIYELALVIAMFNLVGNGILAILEWDNAYTWKLIAVFNGSFMFLFAVIGALSAKRFKRELGYPPPSE